MERRTGDDAPPTRRSDRAVEVWLRSEHLSKEERLERLANDADLVADLRADGFTGQDWEFFANELARYGVAVISGWMRRGIITSKCAEKRIKVKSLPDSVRGDVSAVQAIAGETVAVALDHFREEVLIPGAWNSAKGASLRTFFIGQCLRRYGNILQSWLNHELPVGYFDDPEGEFDTIEAGRRLNTVEDDAIRTVAAQVVLRGASSTRAARALAMDACQYSNAEIASDLGMTVSAVQSLLKRERARLRRDPTLRTKEGTA